MIIGTIREEISDPVIHLTKISNDAIIKESLDVKIDYSIQFSFRVRSENNVPVPLFINRRAQQTFKNKHERGGMVEGVT